MWGRVLWIGWVGQVIVGRVTQGAWGKVLCMGASSHNQVSFQ